MIEIFGPRELERARAAGAVVADVLHELRGRATVGVNLLDIDEWARQLILDAGARSCYVDYAPSFGKGPFGHYICTGQRRRPPRHAARLHASGWRPSHP